MLNIVDINSSDPLLLRAERESQAVMHAIRLQRVEIELRAIDYQRRVRILRKRSVWLAGSSIVALATGFAGYWIGSSNVTPTVQMHVIERSTDAPHSQSPAGSDVAPNLAVIPAVAVASQQIAVGQAPSPVAPVSLPAVLARPPQRIAQNQRVVPIPPQPARTAQSQPQAPAPAPPSIAKPTVQPLNGIDVVLPKPDVSKLPDAGDAKPADSSVKPVAIRTTDAGSYKVLNVFEDAVVVRSGQSVRHVKIGEKMPDGQTLKSVAADKGRFETAP